MRRNFEEWIGNFRESIADYGYYINFDTVVKNVEEKKKQLKYLNSLLISENIETDFEKVIQKNPECLKCIPILLAIRGNEISARDEEGQFNYNFNEMNYSLNQYITFMRKTGLFDMMKNHISDNLIDFVAGVEVGLNSNARKNRGGHLMENLVEHYLNKENIVSCNKKNLNEIEDKLNHDGKIYCKEMYLNKIEDIFGLDLSPLSRAGNSTKRFDFVVKTKTCVYAIETNFYKSSGSKLNETAKSYMKIAEDSMDIDGFKFVWFTDGKGWCKAKNVLRGAFGVIDNLYSIDDIENGIMEKIFI